MEHGATLSSNWPPSLDDLLSDAPEARTELLSLFARARARSVEHVHIEPTDDGARLRLRTADGFDESRLAADAPVLLACQRVDEQLALAGHASGAVFSVMLNDSLQHVSVTRRSTRRGVTRVLTLQGSELSPPRLEELIDDPRRLRRLRDILVRGNGWIAVGTSARLDGERLVRAIGQELASPDQKLIGIEPALHPTIARMEQFDRDTSADTIDAFDPDTVLLCATPSDVTLTRLAASAAERRRIIHRCQARQPSAVLNRYLALGLPLNWLEHVLSAVIMRYQLRLLCHGCRLRLSPEEQLEPYHHVTGGSGHDTDPFPAAPCDTGLADSELYARELSAAELSDTARSRTGLSHWLARSFETRFEVGGGCDSCEGTGYAGVRIITDPVVIDAATRMALRTGDLDGAMRRVDSGKGLQEVLGRLVAAGEIAPAEAARHLAQRHY